MNELSCSSSSRRSLHALSHQSMLTASRSTRARHPDSNHPASSRYRLSRPSHPSACSGRLHWRAIPLFLKHLSTLVACSVPARSHVYSAPSSTRHLWDYAIMLIVDWVGSRCRVDWCVPILSNLANRHRPNHPSGFGLLFFFNRARCDHLRLEKHACDNRCVTVCSSLTQLSGASTRSSPPSSPPSSPRTTP